MDTVYPEPMSMLRRRAVRKKLRGQKERYRTQPVTFAEIQEVDEENIDDTATNCATVSSKRKPHVEIDINKKFDEFKRLHDAVRLERSNLKESPTEVTPSNSPVDEKKHSPLENSSTHPKILGNQRNNSTHLPLGKIKQRPSI